MRVSWHVSMPCCRCNRKGSCKGCACVKAGKPCSSCLPSKLGTCANRPSMRSCAQQPSNLSTQVNAPSATSPPEISAATIVSADYAITIGTASETPSSSPNFQPNSDVQQLSTVSIPINAPPASGPLSNAVDAISAVYPTNSVITTSEISSSSTDSQPAFSPTSSTPFRWKMSRARRSVRTLGKPMKNRLSGVRIFSPRHRAMLVRSL